MIILFFAISFFSFQQAGAILRSQAFKKKGLVKLIPYPKPFISTRIIINCFFKKLRHRPGPPEASSGGRGGEGREGKRVGVGGGGGDGGKGGGGVGEGGWSQNRPFYKDESLGLRSMY